MSGQTVNGGTGGSSSQRIPIVIAGGGSVGLSLAAELGWRGIDCLVVEERDGLNPHPRANAVANRTMEYCRRWGIDEAISAAGVPPELPADYYWITSFFGRQIHHVSLPPFRELEKRRGSGGYASGEHQWSPYLKTITGQDEVEKAILEFVQACPTVDMRFGWRLCGFTQDAHGVTCQVEDVATGAQQTVACDYLAACDGGRSAVRETLGIPLSGRANLASFVSIYFRAPEFMSAHKFGHANIYFPLRREYAGFVLNWDGGKTFTYHLILEDGQDWQDVDPIPAIYRMLGAETPVEVLSVQPWKAHALVADTYRDGRVFLAGDSAHLFTPTGGFGMNTGVSDVIDLAWKMEAMLDGWGGDELLESYTTERRPVGLRNTQEAADCFDRLYGVMQNGPEIDDESPDSDALRERITADLKDQEKLVVSSGTLLGYRYEGSPIVVPDGTLEPPDHARQYIATARPGHRAPHVWLEDGASILDRFGPHFTLLLFGEDPEPNGLAAAAAAAGVPLKTVHIGEVDAAEVYGARMILVRPDLMVAWRSDTTPGDPARIIDIIRGAST